MQDTDVIRAVAMLIGIALGLTLAGVCMHVKLQMDWEQHAQARCYPYALYEARAADFSWMCANKIVDSFGEPR